MIDFKIEKGVPFVSRQGRHSGIGECLTQLEVGDSFTFPTSERSHINNAISYQHRKRGKLGPRYSCQLCYPPNGMSRIWRIK